MSLTARFRWRALFTASLALNLGLLALLTVSRDPPSNDRSSGRSTAPSLLPSQRPSAPKFNWAQVESTSITRLLANLQSIGCPERFQHHAVIADIDREYEAKRRKIAHLSHFWQSNDARVAEEKDRQEQLRQLNREWDQAIENATGKPATFAIRKDYPDDDHVAMRALRFGFLSPEKEEMASAYLGSTPRQIRSRASVQLEEAPLEKLIAQHQSHHATILENTRGFMREAELHSVAAFDFQIYLFDVWDSKEQFGRELSPAETHEITQILMPPDYLTASRFDLPLASIHDDQIVASRQAALREQFGEELFEHYRAFTKDHTPQNIVFPRR